MTDRVIRPAFPKYLVLPEKGLWYILSRCSTQKTRQNKQTILIVI